jgi:sugar/nucleoside kinase (ribokinase family)
MHQAVCAGHICLDIFPKFPPNAGTLGEVFIPGKLVNVGELHFSTGGAVSNTGIAMNKLGTKTVLMSKVGDDEIAGLISGVIRNNFGLEDTLLKVQGEQSSYSIVISLPGTDRIFLHNPGANDTMSAADLDYGTIGQASLFHFGYPSLIKKMFSNGGRELLTLFKKVRSMGVTTSLDMSLPDPNSESGRVDWLGMFEELLPYVDIFVPSFEEALYMIDRKDFNAKKAAAPNGDILKTISIEDIASLGNRILQLGAKIALVKCGEAGLYVKTAEKDKIAGLGKAAPKDPAGWAGKEIFSGIYKVDDVKSTTGAGDTAIAGFLCALMRGHPLDEAVNTACGTAAFCVQTYGAVDGIPSLENVVERIDQGWAKRTVMMPLDGWNYDVQSQLYAR